jgi:hypothetical protein
MIKKQMNAKVLKHLLPRMIPPYLFYNNEPFTMHLISQDKPDKVNS